MSTSNFVLFLVSGGLAIVGAIGTVASRKPLRAAVALLLHIIALAALYLTLHAELLAALQLLVYAGAIVVLFVFVIMLIGPAAEVPSNPRGKITRLLSLVVGGSVMATVSFALVGHTAPRLPMLRNEAGENIFGTVEGMGVAIYQQALVPFELVSAALLVAIIGAIAIARSRTPQEQAVVVERQAERIELAAARDAELAQATAKVGS